MPQDLRDALGGLPSKAEQGRAISTWNALTDDERSRIRNYVDFTEVFGIDERRCRRAARTLAAGQVEPGGVLGMLWKFVETVVAAIGGGMPTWLMGVLDREDEKSRPI